MSFPFQPWYSFSMMLSILMTLMSISINIQTVQAQAICQQSSFGEFSLDNSQCFTLAAGTEASAFRFSCANQGSRVAYTSADYSVLPVADGGGNAETGQLSLWTVENSASDTLTLAACQVTGGCLVRGFLDCSCENVATGQPCDITTISPPQGPTPSPTTAFPDCPDDKTTDTRFCKWLLENQVPIPDPGCDCYNFCRGEFQSCCNQLSNSCGITECLPDASNGNAQPGTLESYVQGCHEGHLTDPNQEEPPNPPEPWNPFRAQTREVVLADEDKEQVSTSNAKNIVSARLWVPIALAMTMMVAVMV